MQGNGGHAGNWKALAQGAELEPGSMRSVKLDGHPLALGRTAQGELFCVDDRCPHEGYPLATGYLAQELLTCAWHNWKFDVRDGACVLGGEAVRAHGVRERDGVVEVELTLPDPAREVPRLLASVQEGLARFETDRVLREVVRLLLLGVDPWRLLAELALDDARRAEYGTTHVLALAADCGRVLERYAGPRAAIALAPVIDLAGETNQRLFARERPGPIGGGSAEALRAAIEGEDAARAEGLVLGAFEEGRPRREVAAWIAAALSDHLLDFGHPLIYLVKGEELLGRVEERFAAPILGSLVHSMVLGTREDTLPYLAPWFRRLATVEARLPELLAASRAGADFDAQGLRAAVLDAPRVEAAFGALWSALEAGAEPRAIARALVEAAAERLWRFDLAVERDPDGVESWLWATHRFTFAAAVRQTVERHPGPDSLRLLVQCAAFVHNGRGLDAPLAERLDPDPVAGDPDSIRAAIVAKDAPLAVARLRGYLESGGAIGALQATLEDLVLADPAVRPIVVTHAIKTTFAALEERAALAGSPGAERPLEAAVRFLASPIVERRISGLARRSIRWVAEGRMPPKRTQ